MTNFWKAIENFDWDAGKRTVYFRVYHDDAGNILSYSNDDLPGNYIEVTPEVWACNRYDLVVRNGKLVAPTPPRYKLVPDQTGTPCHTDYVTIVVSQQNNTKWNLKVYED